MHVSRNVQTTEPRWPNAVRVDDGAKASIKAVERTINHAAVMGLQGHDQIEAAGEGRAPYTDKLEAEHGAHMVHMAQMLQKDVFNAFGPMLAQGIHAATSAEAYKAMTAYLGVNTLLRALDGNAHTPDRSLQEALESHAKAYLSASAGDVKSVDRILQDYAPNAIAVTTLIPGEVGNGWDPAPDGSKYTKIAQTPEALRVKFVEELDLVKPREKEPIVDSLTFEGELALLTWHTESGIKARDVYAIDDAGKIWFHGSYLKLPRG